MASVLAMCLVDLPTWLTAIATCFAALAAGVGIWLGRRIANRQEALLSRQLDQDLFDKRYAVFDALEDFGAGVQRDGGRFNHDDYLAFLNKTAQAKFLFDDDTVQSYMDRFKKSACALVVEKEHPTTKQNQDVQSLIKKYPELAGLPVHDQAWRGLFLELVEVYDERIRVFTPYLAVGKSLKK